MKTVTKENCPAPFGFSRRIHSALESSCYKPIPIGPLVYFRIVFGLTMFWEVIRYFEHGWIHRYYIQPSFFFSYYGFDWIRPLPGFAMYAVFASLGLLALGIAAGFFYKRSILLFFVGFTYIFLLDETNYLNHFYLISLISGLLVFLPAHQAFSLDSGRRRSIQRSTVPAWTLNLLRFQLAIPYIYGGIAKLNHDWLHGEPMRDWLRSRTEMPLIGGLFEQDWAAYAFSYGGLLFDLCIVPLLLWRRTRWLGVALALVFHLLNSQLFAIGVFPWLMLLSIPLFFPATWCNVLMCQMGVSIKPTSSARRTSTGSHRLKALATLGIACYMMIQVLLPLRHHLYPGNPSWSEEGHRFAWHMKLRDKEATARFVVSDQQSGISWLVDPSEYLTSRQVRKMSTHPDMILQFAHHLEEIWRDRGFENVEVYARVEASLNGRRHQTLVDPDIDLSTHTRSIWHSHWIVPLREPLMPPSNDQFVSR